MLSFHVLLRGGAHADPLAGGQEEPLLQTRLPPTWLQPWVQERDPGEKGKHHKPREKGSTESPPNSPFFPVTMNLNNLPSSAACHWVHAAPVVLTPSLPVLTFHTAVPQALEVPSMAHCPQDLRYVSRHRLEQRPLLSSAGTFHLVTVKGPELCFSSERQSIGANRGFRGARSWAPGHGDVSLMAACWG